MTNQERVLVLSEAMDLIREVEFSFPCGDPTRKEINKIVSDMFGSSGSLTKVIEVISPKNQPELKLAEG